MTNGTRIWLRSLAAAAISGAANSVTGTTGAAMFAPEAFNAQDGLANTLGLAAFLLVSGAALGTFAYLKQSPLPPPEADQATAGPPAA